MGALEFFTELERQESKVKAAWGRMMEAGAADGVRSVAFDQVARGSGVGSKVEKAAERRELAIKEYEKATAILQNMRAEAETVIEALRGKDYTVMYLRYVSGYPLPEVAEAVGIGRGYCRRVRNRAIGKIKE